MAKFFIIARSQPEVLLGAEISSRVTREDFIHTDAKWANFKRSHARQSASLPDHHDWNWGRKSIDADHEHGFLALKFEGEIEGYLMFSSDPVPSRHYDNPGAPVLYVDYLETAPWNQRDYAGESARFWGVGVSLMSAAIEMSKELGCEGRLGLHSLESAKKFYMAQGFTNLGFDAVEQLDYLEFRDKVE
jgi:GNAT superfamily N-acetyltransferase